MNWSVVAFALSFLAVPAIVAVGLEHGHSILGYAGAAILVGVTWLVANARSE